MRTIIQLLLAFFVSFASKAQTYSDYYSLDKCDGQYMRWNEFSKVPHLKDTIKTDGRLSFLRYKSGSFFNQYLPIVFSREQLILLPKEERNNCRVSVSYKNNEISQASFQVLLLDDYSEIIDRYETKLHIGNTMAGISFPLGNSTFMKIRINVSDTTFTYKEFDLYEIKITLDGKSIDSFPLNLGCAKDIDLGMINMGFPDIPDKRIIGIGENMHGTSTLPKIGIEIIKDRILNHNCKLVLFELPHEFVINVNYLTSDSLPCIQDSQLSNVTKQYMDFVKWINEYNKTSGKKVVIAGIDNTDIKNDLFRYLLYHVSSMNKDSELKHISSMVPEEKFLDSVERDSSIWKYFTPEEKFLLNYTFHQKQQIKEQMKKEKKHLESFRDSIMAVNVETFINHFCGENENVVVYAHFGHMSKVNTICNYFDVKPLGSIINDNYADDYYCLGLFGMDGECLCYPNYNTYYQKINLRGFSPWSVEYQIKDYDKTISIPANAFPDEFVLGNIFGNVASSYNYGFINFRKASDAIVFIRNMKPIDAQHINNIKDVKVLMQGLKTKYLDDRLKNKKKGKE